ncbi:MAG: flavin reductase [Clostridia bacterium]|nr:flavin reductase [Clostridia bacterium]
MSFKEINVRELDGNFFTKIGKEWMLITAGDEEKFNTMTASWGGIGILWGTNVTFTFIRQSRYTYEFVDNNPYYTLSFFGGNLMKELTYCGKNSGRDVDKIKETGLTPVFDAEAPYFEQAELVLVCRKLHKQTISPEGFIDKKPLETFYSDKDWHEAFVGEIVKVLKKD